MKFKKQRIISIIAVLTMAIVLSFVFVACGTDADKQGRQFTITFDTQGGSKIEPIKIKAGATITLPNNPTKEGYIFDGWYLSDALVEEFNITKTITGDITLYAKWIEDNGQEEPPVAKTYSITFMVDGVTYKTLNITAGDVIPLPLDPTKEGYVFDGWYLGDNFIEKFDVSKKITSNVVVYSKWKCQHIPVKNDAFAPTCTQAGLSEGSHCSKCGEILIAQQVIPPKGHTEVTDNEVPPTCVLKGKTEGSHCSDCGEIIVAQNDIPALGHSFVNKKCERCGEDYYSEGLDYWLIEDGNYYELRGIGSCKDSDIVIPSKHDGKPVKSVGMECFGFCETITSITIPDSITRIEENAFSYCKNLASITVANGNTTYHSAGNCLIKTQDKILVLGCKNSVIPADGSVTRIGKNAFAGCTGLSSITIPDSVTSIGPGSFARTGLTSVTIPDSVTSIGGSSFYDCTGLTSVTIGNGVTSIGSYAFYVCTGLTSVSIPDSVTSLGDYAFYGCTGLTSITIPDSVTSIGSSAFYNCTGLTSISGSATNVSTVAKQAHPTSFTVNITSGTSIGNYAFENCTGLMSITITDSVTSIGSWAFEDCSGLTSITIPDGVTNVGNCAFKGCSGLTTVNWNASACTTSSYYPIFSNCPNLTTVNIGDNVTTIPSYVFYTCTGLSSITIPDSVTSIGAEAFSGCTGLTSVTIPDSVTSIGSSAFYNCTGLTSISGSATNVSTVATQAKPTSFTVNITSGTSIGNSAFEGCSGLTSITIPESVTSIGSWSFEDCRGFTSITIPDSVTSIGDHAFYGCYKLVEVYNKSTLSITVGNSDNGYIAYYAKNVYTTEGGSKLSMDENGYVIYTDGDEKILVAYTGAETELTLPADITQINRAAFYGCSGLTSITIPDSVTNIDDYTFYGCAGFTSITIPDSVTSIGKSAFYGCAGLTSITIPDSVTSIGSSAFYNCTGLTSITIGKGVTSIGISAFSCRELTSISVVEGNTKYHCAGNCLIETESKTLVFGCKTSVIPTDGSVTSIGVRAFNMCSNLTSIIIPDSVTSIDNYAFDGCTSLTSITIGNGVTSIGEEAFWECTGLTSITFNGTIEEWCSISKGPYWNVGVPRTCKVNCTDGDISILET